MKVGQAGPAPIVRFTARMAVVTVVTVVGLLVMSATCRADTLPIGADVDAAAGAASAHPPGRRDVAAGPLIELAAPPQGSDAWPRACSFRDPLCVHAMPGTPAATEAATLAAAERAWETLTGALAAPPPEPGLDGPWPVYLVDHAAAGAAPSLARARDPRGAFDRVASFGLVDRDTAPGCALDLALARAVARASLWAAAPATDPGTSEASVEALARLASPCATTEQRDDDAEFQRSPERTVVDPRSPSFNRGAAMFFGWLDRRFGARPGAVLVGLWSLSPTTTPATAWRWAGAPTEIDVLRVSLASALWQGSGIDDAFAAFAAARATMDPRPRLTWRIPWPVERRRLAQAEPVGPTGASYVAIDHTGAPRGANLHLEASWEDYGRMRWIVLKLDANGKVVDELPIPSTERATQAVMTVENLDGVDRVVVIGLGLGSTETPFDPDDGVWEPHGWLLTVASEGAR
jgi:hypothetical protein